MWLSEGGVKRQIPKKKLWYYKRSNDESGMKVDEQARWMSSRALSVMRNAVDALRGVGETCLRTLASPSRIIAGSNYTAQDGLVCCSR